MLAQAALEKLFIIWLICASELILSHEYFLMITYLPCIGNVTINVPGFP